MPGGILILWPTDPALDTSAQVAAARAAAPEREPVRVLVAGGDSSGSVADARLDNAGELIKELGLVPSASDDEVLDAAAARWGARFPEHLAGDFAWARWEPGERSLMLVRDHMGIRPLVFGRYRGGFAAATDVRSLCALPGVDTRWDELYIAMSLTDIWLDSSSTFFTGIRRLPPGSLAHVRSEGRIVKVEDYWTLPSEDLRLATEADYLHRFRSLFVESVSCRMPASGCIASELSGGLDSTVVTAALAEMSPSPPILALAASFAEDRYEEGRHDEGAHRRWAAEDPRIDLLELPASSMITRGSIERLMSAHGSPMAPVMDLIRLHLWKQAHDRGASVVFDGFDGDTTVNYGFERIPGLARRGHFIDLGREAFSAYMKAGRRGLRETAVLLTNSSMHSVMGRVRDPRAIRLSLATRALLERSGFLEAYRTSPASSPGDVRGEHSIDVRSGTIALAIERLDVAAAAASVEVRHPFFDRRLVEFCISLPPHLLFRQRMPRWIQRAALDGFGPTSVLWRHDKGAMPNQLADEALIGLGAERSSTGPPTSLVDPAALLEALASWRNTRDPSAASSLYPAFELARWLERSDGPT